MHYLLFYAMLTCENPVEYNQNTFYTIEQSYMCRKNISFRKNQTQSSICKTTHMFRHKEKNMDIVNLCTCIIKKNFNA